MNTEVFSAIADALLNAKPEDYDLEDLAKVAPIVIGVLKNSTDPSDIDRVKKLCQLVGVWFAELLRRQLGGA